MKRDSVTLLAGEKKKEKKKFPKKKARSKKKKSLPYVRPRYCDNLLGGEDDKRKNLTVWEPQRDKTVT